MRSVYILFLGLSQLASAQPLDLTIAKFHPVIFEKIPPTLYENTAEGALKATVKASSSALLLAFDQVLTPKRAIIVWRHQGDITGQTRATEESKTGDDFFLRIGACLAGEKVWIPFFAPAWVKQIAKIAKQPTNKMLYLTLGSLHKDGETWTSPYTSSINNVAVADTLDANGWRTATYDFAAKTKVVALWLMADGDNTKAQFTTEIKSIELTP